MTDPQDLTISRRLHTKCKCQTLDRFQTHGSLAPFDQADVCAMKARDGGKCFLGQALLLPQSAYLLTKPLLKPFACHD